MLAKVAQHGDTNKLYACEVFKSKFCSTGNPEEFFSREFNILLFIYFRSEDQINMKEKMVEVSMPTNSKNILSDTFPILRINSLRMPLL